MDKRDVRVIFHKLKKDVSLHFLSEVNQSRLEKTMFHPKNRASLFFFSPILLMLMNQKEGIGGQRSAVK